MEVGNHDGVSNCGQVGNHDGDRQSRRRQAIMMDVGGHGRSGQS